MTAPTAAAPQSTNHFGLTEADKKKMAMQFLVQGLQNAGQQGPASMQAPVARQQPQIMGGGQLITQGR